ncbi:MAG TPA: NAD-dependent epimerase/dehydratase family protein [Negativicutes bacterium]|nr:NAD-dependent epimerase/dehydratase family protein [Negativicutes bacterium]
MNVLITGGYGFIGSHVAEEFFREGHRIFIIDNLSTGDAGNIRFKHASFIVDIGDARCSEIFRSNRFDAVIHLAAQINVISSINDPCSDARSNILGLTNMLQLSAQYGVKKFVFASSTAVYGSNPDIPLKEEAMPDPLSPYGMSKATGELYCRKWNDIYGLSTICFRPANVYGPRQGIKGEGGVVSIFMERAAEGKELVIFGDGNQTRDFIYVKDIANAIYRAVEADISGIYNLSTNSESSINDLVQVLGQLQPVKFVNHKAGRDGDIRNSCLDNSKLRSAIDWEPRYSLAEGLKSTHAWYVEHHNRIEKSKQEGKDAPSKNPVSERLSAYLRSSGLLYLMENLLLFGIAGLMTIMSQNSPGSHFLDYKLVYTVLAGIIYGTRQAVLASLLSCGLCIYLYLGGGHDIVSLVYNTDSLLQLFFYLLVGIITGCMTDNRKNELQVRTAELRSLNEELEFRTKLHNETLLIKDELCDQVISAQNSYGKIYEIINRLNSIKPKEVLTRSIEVLENAMKSDEVAIYALSESKYYVILSAKSGKSDFNAPGIAKIKEREDIRRVMETGDYYINYEGLSSLPLITIPIKCNGNVAAVACIYKAEFENIMLYRQKLLGVTAYLISYALENAYRFSEATQERYIDLSDAAETGIHIVKQKRQ